MHLIPVRATICERQEILTRGVRKTTHGERGLTRKYSGARCGRKVIEEGGAAQTADLGRVPRISRLVALAIYMRDLVNRGEVADYAELARLGQVSAARITQIMNLLHLAPDILEEILNLPRTIRGRDAVTERQHRLVAAVPAWREQRAMWSELTPAVRSESGAHVGDDAPAASIEPSTAEGITPGPATASGVSACGMLPRTGLG